MTDRISAPIPRFALYGEEGEGNDPGFVHIETIMARSERYAWEIRAHRHGYFFQLLLLRSGGAVIDVDGKNRTTSAPALIVVPPGIVHGFRFVPGIEGVVLTLSSDFIHRASGAADPLHQILEHARLISLAPEVADRLGRVSLEMLDIQADRRDGQRALLSAFAETWVRLAARSIDRTAAVLQDDPRMDRLRGLVEQHFHDQKPVSFYAEALGMTVRNLSRLTQRHFGCTPKDLINRRVALEARRLLLYSNASGRQVATELGFQDPSYFSRFYERMTGARPSRELEARRNAL